MSRNPEVTPQSVSHEFGLAGPEAKGSAAARWEKIQQELLARGRAIGFEEGKAMGFEEGMEIVRKRVSRTLLIIAERRFGRVKAEHQARIESATYEDILAWTLAVGSGEVEGLEELFSADQAPLTR